MEEALSFFRAFELWIYLLLGFGALIFVRRFILAWQELRGAAFGLERENAQSRLNQAASALVLFLTLAMIEFVLVSFIAPAVPGAIPLPTPTLDLLATPTITLPAGEALPAGAPATLIPQNGAQPGFSPASGCLPGQITISIPKSGEEVSGVVPIVGTANIPDFGHYTFQIKRPDDPLWLTISAGNIPTTEGKLGDWDTTRLSPGDYQLALVVMDNQAKASPACIIQVRVARPADTPAP
jgi:hypothetical protein